MSCTMVWWYRLCWYHSQTNSDRTGMKHIQWFWRCVLDITCHVVYHGSGQIESKTRFIKSCSTSSDMLYLTYSMAISTLIAFADTRPQTCRPHNSLNKFKLLHFTFNLILIVAVFVFMENEHKSKIADLRAAAATKNSIKICLA